MKEEIEKVLSDETFTTNEEKVDAITKALGSLVIPKEKYNELNNKLKTAENNFSTLNTEYEDFKKSKMTDDEKIVEEKKKFEAEQKANKITRSELEVEKLLLKNGIEIKDDDVELKETLSNIVSDDLDKSIKLANNFITLLNKTKEKTEKQTITNLLNDTPKPNFGNPNGGNASNYETYKAKYDEAVKSGNFIDMATYSRLMQEEQRKQQTVK